MLEARSEGDFKHPLQYIINGKHFFELEIIGKVIKPFLHISKTEVKFVACEDDKQVEKHENVVVTNPHNYPISFEWSSGKTSLFKFTP